MSLFVDPDLEQVKEAHKLDAEAIEINTAAYSERAGPKAQEAALRKVIDAARLGRKLGLEVHAGHGLTYDNVGAIAALSELSELNIGHNIVARAVLVGMEPRPCGRCWRPCGGVDRARRPPYPLSYGSGGCRRFWGAD